MSDERHTRQAVAMLNRKATSACTRYAFKSRFVSAAETETLAFSAFL